MYDVLGTPQWLVNSQGGSNQEKSSRFSPQQRLDHSLPAICFFSALFYLAHSALSVVFCFIYDIYVVPSSSLSCWLFIIVDGLMRMKRRRVQSQWILLRVVTAGLFSPLCFLSFLCHDSDCIPSGCQ